MCSWASGGWGLSRACGVGRAESREKWEGQTDEEGTLRDRDRIQRAAEPGETKGERRQSRKQTRGGEDCESAAIATLSDFQHFSNRPRTEIYEGLSYTSACEADKIHIAFVFRSSPELLMETGRLRPKAAAPPHPGPL